MSHACKLGMFYCFIFLTLFMTTSILVNYTTTNCIYSTVQFSTISLSFYFYCGISMLNEHCITIGKYCNCWLDRVKTNIWNVYCHTQHEEENVNNRIESILGCLWKNNNYHFAFMENRRARKMILDQRLVSCQNA